MKNVDSIFINFFLALASLPCFVNSLEPKPINYEVDILQTPIRRGEDLSQSIIHMTSKYGQEYRCILPQIDEEEVSEKESVSEKNTDIIELLKPLKKGPCLLKGKDWWTYEFCFGHYIKQFHIEDGQIIGKVITLGHYDSDYDWNNETDQEKFKNVKQRYHSQTYVNGTKCDLTGQPRNAEVRFFCEEDAGDYISRLDEPGTCSYIITVHTSRLCSHPLLKPLPSKKAHAIPCHPLLNDDQYSKYLEKLNVEKELADLKRSQWLNNQQERLQVMKNENLMSIENEVSKMKEELKANEENPPEKDGGEEEVRDKTKSTEESTAAKGKNARSEVTDSERFAFMKEQYEELEKLKPYLLPEKFADIKNHLQKKFDKIFRGEAPSLELFMQKLDGSANKIVKDGKETKESDIKEAADEASEDEVVEGRDKLESKLETGSRKDSLVDEGPSKSEDKETSMLDDDELHVRIRRLDRRSTDPNGKVYGMDLVQKKLLEQAVKEKLEKAGLDTGGRRIEVKIITAGYYDNEEGKDFHSLTEEETNQFQNMIMALLTGQQEAVQEIERHKKLEDNYKYTWQNNEDNED